MLASGAFHALNEQVQGLIRGQLKAGPGTGPALRRAVANRGVRVNGQGLVLGFRGTQGLTVTGSGVRKSGRYVGTLTYVIRDSYGFPADDTLDGFGPPMRYLQTVCGAPQHAGGAHWFPDTITATVPLSQPE